jgi:hypothetical protein
LPAAWIRGRAPQTWDSSEWDRDKTGTVADTDRTSRPAHLHSLGRRARRQVRADQQPFIGEVEHGQAQATDLEPDALSPASLATQLDQNKPAGIRESGTEVDVVDAFLGHQGKTPGWLSAVKVALLVRSPHARSLGDEAL